MFSLHLIWEKHLSWYTEQTNRTPACSTGDEGRASYKPTLSIRAFQDLMKLGTGKKAAHRHSSLWSHSVSHGPTGSRWHLLFIYFLMVLENPATSIMLIANSQTIYSENQAVDLCSACSERPFPMVTGDSSDNTTCDHSSLLCSNTLTHSSINQPGATAQASHRNEWQAQKLTKSRRQTSTVTIWELTEGKTGLESMTHVEVSKESKGPLHLKGSGMKRDKQHESPKEAMWEEDRKASRVAGGKACRL